MGKFVQDVRLSRARIAQYDEFMRDTLENAKQSAGINHFLAPSLAAFRAAVEAFHALVSRPLRWELTPEITEADNALDKALSALRYMMKAAVENPDAEAAAAAKVVLRMSEIDKINGQMQMDEESGKITEMLTTLLGEYHEQTQKAGIMPFVMQLKERNEHLCALLQERDLTQGEVGNRDTAELRAKTDTDYRKLIFDVNSVVDCISLGLITVTGSDPEPFTAFIDYQNGHIDRFHREVLRTKGTSKPEEGVEEDVVVGEETEETENGGNGGTGSGNTGSGSQGGENSGSGSGNTGSGSGSGTGSGSGSSGNKDEDYGII